MTAGRQSTMDTWKPTLGWITLALIFGGIGLSVFAAFLGAEKSRLLFSSGPMLVLWVAMVVLMVIGLWRFRSLRHCPGLLAMHVGPLLILIGGMVNSDRGHRVLYPEQTRWSYLPLRVNQRAQDTRDASLHRITGRLPFEVRLDAFEIERYPADDPTPVFKYGYLTHDHATHRTEWTAQALAGWGAGEVELPGTAMRLAVLALRDEEGAAREADIAVTLNGIRRTHRLIPEPDASFGRVSLSALFPEATGLPPGASVFILHPEPPVRQYRSHLTFLTEDGDVSKLAWVNRPVRFGGYHFYQYAWGEEPELHTILLVVSRAGTRLTFAGLVLVVAGAFWRLWFRPRQRRIGRSPACT